MEEKKIFSKFDNYSVEEHCWNLEIDNFRESHAACQHDTIAFDYIVFMASELLPR